MISKHYCYLWLLFAPFGFSAGDVSGAVQAFTASGVVTQITDGNHTLGGKVQVGDPFSCKYSYDPLTPDQLPGDPAKGRYSLSPPLTATVGTLSLFSSGLMVIDIDNAVFNDSHDVLSQFTSGNYFIKEFSVQLYDPRGLAFQNDSLPVSVPRLSLFSSRTFLIQGGTSGGDFVIQGNITAIVPEPQTWFLAIAVAPFENVRKWTRRARSR